MNSQLPDAKTLIIFLFVVIVVLVFMGVNIMDIIKEQLHNFLPSSVTNMIIPPNQSERINEPPNSSLYQTGSTLYLGEKEQEGPLQITSNSFSQIPTMNPAVSKSLESRGTKFTTVMPPHSSL
jgi:hypothetical protein